MIGLGTWQTFDIGESPLERQALEKVLSLFVKLGGTVIDSSPMYGRAEQVVGDLASKLQLQDKLFFATKVWTRGKQPGIESIQRSQRRFKVKRFNLMQVHNLLDVQTHLATLRAMKEQGLVQYIGITHYNSSAFGDVEDILKAEPLDFLQINYSIMERDAEKRVLPLAQERRVAVLVNRPFGGGNLFSRVTGKPLPGFAKDIGCNSWAQFFLKWIVAHSAVTCAIPATSKATHLEDNMGGGLGVLPDEKTRKQMVETVSAL